jgi:hypothetical protein
MGCSRQLSPGARFQNPTIGPPGELAGHTFRMRSLSDRTSGRRGSDDKQATELLTFPLNQYGADQRCGQVTDTAFMRSRTED